MASRFDLSSIMGQFDWIDQLPVMKASRQLTASVERMTPLRGLKWNEIQVVSPHERMAAALCPRCSADD